MVAAAIVIALAPALICFGLLIAVRAWKSDAAGRVAWAVPLAVAAGFVAAQLAIDGAPRIPPIEASGWFSPLAVLLAVFAITAKPVLSRRVAAAVAALLALVMVVVLVHPLIGGAWSPADAVMWIAGMAAIAFVMSWLVDCREILGPGVPLTLLIAASGVAGVLVLCGSARYGQLSGAVASVMGPLVLLGVFRRDMVLLRAGAWLSMMILAMLVAAGVAYVDVPLLIALPVIAAAPLGMLAGELPALSRWPWWGRDLVRCATAAVLVGIAMAQAFIGQSTPY